jgi:hypothetical protein
MRIVYQLQLQPTMLGCNEIEPIAIQITNAGFIVNIGFCYRVEILGQFEHSALLFPGLDFFKGRFLVGLSKEVDGVKKWRVPAVKNKIALFSASWLRSASH